MARNMNDPRRDSSISSSVFYVAIPILIIIAVSLAYFWSPNSQVNRAETAPDTVAPSPSAPAPPAATPNTQNQNTAPNTQSPPAQ